MVTEIESLLALTSLIISIFAASISLLRFKKESMASRQANTVTTFYDIGRLIDNDRTFESRGLLRANAELNRLKDLDPDDNDAQIPELDDKEATRYVATTYDRSGFILKHDPKLEQEILEWNADVIADMWMMTRMLVKKKWRMRNPKYAREFERLAEKPIVQMRHAQEKQYS